MIDWNLTTANFGIDQSSKLGKRPKVICRCDQCSITKIITVRTKSRLNAGFPWLCPSCVNLKRSDTISQATKQMWSNNEYRELHSTISKQQWSDTSYRERHKESVRLAMTKVDMSAHLRERYKDPAARQKIKEISTKLWEDEALRARHFAIMNKDEVRKAISREAKQRWKTNEYRLKMAEIRSQQSGQISAIQQMLYKLLDDLDIEYHKEGEKTRIGYYCFDCLIPSANLLIECQGDYWHSLNTVATRDKQKFTYINRYYPQYKIAYFWEREFYQHDRVVSRLRALLGQTQQILNFKLEDVTIKKVDATKHFLDLYHYLGPGRGGIKYGAFLGETLIAVAVFSKPIRQNIIHQFGDGALECSRFCIHPLYQKRNFASWFLSRCTKQFSNIIIYSYADRTVGHTGSIYKAAGWKHHHTVPPDYWYMDNDGYIMHKKTLYNRAQNLKMTENEFATTYNYQKIIGGPKECYFIQLRDTSGTTPPTRPLHKIVYPRTPADPQES